MAAPMRWILRSKVCLSPFTTSIRQCGVRVATHQKWHSTLCVSPQHNRTPVDTLAKLMSNQCRITQRQSFSSLSNQSGMSSSLAGSGVRLSMLSQPTTRFQVEQRRTVKCYSLTKGKKKTVKAVVSRFYRFNSGLWLRCRAGRNNALWKKSKKRRQRLKQFVFCSKNQSTKLDLMVTSYWRRQKNIPDDPFAPFENRNWYGYKDYPGPHYVQHMYKKGMPVDMPYKKHY